MRVQIRRWSFADSNLLICFKYFMALGLGIAVMSCFCASATGSEAFLTAQMQNYLMKRFLACLAIPLREKRSKYGGKASDF